MVRPRPMPPSRRVKKGSKIRARKSNGSPGPAAATLATNVPSRLCAATSMRPPTGAKCSALISRFKNTWMSCSRSQVSIVSAALNARCSRTSFFFRLAREQIERVIDDLVEVVRTKVRRPRARRLQQQGDETIQAIGLADDEAGEFAAFFVEMGLPCQQLR